MKPVQSARPECLSLLLESTRTRTILRRYPLSLTLPATLLFLASCAQTNALMGDHQNAAFSYRSSAQASEKQAKKEADLQNHLVAAQKYIEAAKSRISSAQEYQSLGNPVWTKNMFDKASTDLSSAANEIRSAGESEVH